MPLGSTGSAGSAGPLEAEPNWERSEPLPPAAYRVVDELLRRFGLGSPLEIEVVTSGLLNQNLRAATAAGRFFLKGYRYTDPALILREHRLMAHVAAAGLPVALPLAAPGGATFLRVGGRFWAVFPFIADRQLEPAAFTVAHAAELGRILGAIHAALARYPAAETAAFPPKLACNSAQAADEMRAYESDIAKRPALDPFDQHALASFAYRRTLLASGVPPAAAFAHLPSQLLHGDFHERNVFFTAAGQVSAVIDWELAGIGPRAWEIVRALDLALQAPLDLEAGAPRLRAFIHAYAAEAPLSEAECAAMPELYWAARVHSLWVYEEHYRKGSARTDAVAMADLAGLEWWSRHRQELARALLDALRTAPSTRVARALA